MPIGRCGGEACTEFADRIVVPPNPHDRPGGNPSSWSGQASTQFRCGPGPVEAVSYKGVIDIELPPTSIRMLALGLIGNGLTRTVNRADSARRRSAYGYHEYRPARGDENFTFNPG